MRARISTAVCAIVLSCSPVVTPAVAQTCPGDCNGDGMVGISELVLAVAIVLGAAPLDQCSPLGPLPVGIDKVIAAVNSAQCACRPCPPPAATRTPTATPPPTATPSRTPTVAPAVLESVWREDTARLGSTSCMRDINTAVREALVTVNCPLAVTRRGDTVEVVDCDGTDYDGTIDGAGRFTGAITLSEVISSCTLKIDFAIAVSLSKSPATANYDIAVDFSGACGGLRDCRVQATTRWTRLSGTVAASTAAAPSHGIVRQLLPSLLGR